MDYEVAMDPRLGITAEEFVAAWNEISACHEVAEARVEKASGGQFLTGAETVAVLSVTGAIAGSVALNVASNALYDLLKKAVFRASGKEGLHTETKIVVNVPEGTQVVLVQIAEG